MQSRTVLLVPLLALGMLAAVLAGLPVAEAKPVAPAPPRAVPAVPMPGESFAVRGTLPQRGARPVVLQRRAPDGTWAEVTRARTTAAGRYSFTLRTNVAQVVLRVRAPRTDGAAAVRTPVLTVTTNAPWSVLDLAGDRNAPVVTSRLYPVRPGREVRLQVNRGGWKTLGVQKQGRTAVQTWRISDPGGRPLPYRVIATGWRGAPPYTGGSVALLAHGVDSGLPRITLTTTDAAPVVSKETYVPGTLRIDDGAALPMQVKGRGNSTWNMPKKPYRIKLDTKASLLGLPTEKDWVLLANYADRSLLRNWVAFTTAAATGLGWTPHGTFADVTLNGVDLGTYQLVEQVEASAAKAQLAEGGLLLEVDQRRADNGEPGFTTPLGLQIAFKDPDDPTPAQAEAVATFVAQFEQVLASPTWTDPTTGWTSYVDLSSFADWYLVQEVMKSVDADFFSSVFLTWDPAGKLTMGPVWDFDLSSGFTHADARCCEETDGWWLRAEPGHKRGWQHDVHWFTRITNDPAFQALIAQRWTSVVRPALDAALAALPAQQSAIAAAAGRDWTTWHLDGSRPGTVHAADQPGEVDYLVDYLVGRRAWMDAALS